VLLQILVTSVREGGPQHMGALFSIRPYVDGSEWERV